MADNAQLAAAKLYMHVDGTEDDALIVSLLDAAEDFVSTAGAVRAGAVDARYDLAVQSLTLHWYDHRDALADQSVPSGFDRLLGQLRHREGAL